MESTGVYGKPIWHVLDGQFELVLATAPCKSTACRAAKPT
jgi:hypothetical protein